MGKYRYPPGWRTLTPLERDDFHRHLGALLRRARFLLLAMQVDPRWQRRWWDGERWREPSRQEWEGEA